MTSVLGHKHHLSIIRTHILNCHALSVAHRSIYFVVPASPQYLLRCSPQKKIVSFKNSVIASADRKHPKKIRKIKQLLSMQF